jgi:hypothetical protein
MSTKTTFKRVALVAVAALGLGVLSVAPSQAAPAGDTLALSATTASTTSGTAATVTVTQSFLAEAGDTMTVTASLISFPAGNTVQPAWSSITAVSTDLGSANVDTATARVAKIGSTTGFVNKSLTLSFNGTVAGTYVIRVTPAISDPASLTPVATFKDWTVTVAAKTVGSRSAFIGVTTIASETQTADATVSVTGAASTTAKARIDVAQMYGATGNETASAADGGAVVVTIDKGLISKTNDYTAGAKSVTTAAGTSGAGGKAAYPYWIFSNGDIGKATITITVGGVALTSKTMTFTGAATAMAIALTSGQPAFIGGTGTTTYTVTATDAGGTTATLPTGLTVKSSDTAVATATISSGVVTVTGVKAGTTTITVTDPATTGTVPAVSVTATGAPVRPTSVDITFDAPSYNVGELITMTVSANMGDSATAQLFTSTGVVLSSSVVASGTAIPSGTSHAIVSGKATYKFYAPAVSGNLVVTATSGGAVDVTTAIVLSKTIAIANPGIDAATDAAIEAFDAANAATDAALSAAEAADLATQAAQEASDAVAALSETVTQLIAGLQAQIKTLAAALAKIAALQQKIAKKVKA